MDAQGARDLARRIGSNPGLTARPAPADVPDDSLPLYRWVGGGGGRAAARMAEPSTPVRRTWLRRIRFPGR